MFIIPISKETQDYVTELVKKVDFGNRVSNTGKNGNKEEQFFGICGEVEMQKLFNYPINDGKSGFDGGKDIEFKNLIIDVKTMTRSTDNIRPEWVNNLMKTQTTGIYKNNTYIFTSLNKINMNLTVCGWLSKYQALQRGKFYPKDSIRTKGTTQFKQHSDNYEIQMCDLIDCNSFGTLCESLTKFSDYIKKGK